jgi:hypothetical protein
MRSPQESDVSKSTTLPAISPGFKNDPRSRRAEQIGEYGMAGLHLRGCLVESPDSDQCFLDAVGPESVVVITAPSNCRRSSISSGEGD